ncbi:hypothetical protein BS47DRAFT_1366405 [Hydnum rufescens UP504]|uniref:Uncharacterized protein n=1 Tax=Hydnum rufescens UP504 TaxID=1448309 RepID=A0A9P6DQV1_9AGAM|nr:hypothetical protein BS47DRAFT_1366405 [Hydnum rufescens UP504]
MQNLELSFLSTSSDPAGTGPLVSDDGGIPGLSMSGLAPETHENEGTMQNLELSLLFTFSDLAGTGSGSDNGGTLGPMIWLGWGPRYSGMMVSTVESCYQDAASHQRWTAHVIINDREYGWGQGSTKAHAHDDAAAKEKLAGVPSPTTPVWTVIALVNGICYGRGYSTFYTCAQAEAAMQTLDHLNFATSV